MADSGGPKARSAELDDRAPPNVSLLTYLRRRW